MITEDYVSFETAKLLKEKGFNEKCYVNYSSNGSTQHFNYQAPSDGIPCPTLQMAMKWLRDVHHIFIDIDYDPVAFGSKPYFSLITNMKTFDYFKGHDFPTERETYEEAADTAIRYCLEKLI